MPDGNGGRIKRQIQCCPNAAGSAVYSLVALCSNSSRVLVPAVECPSRIAIAEALIFLLVSAEVGRSGLFRLVQLSLLVIAQVVGQGSICNV